MTATGGYNKERVTLNNGKEDYMNRKTILWGITFTLFVVFFVCSQGFSQEQLYDSEKDFKVRKYGKGVEITRYLGKKTDVMIPPHINNRPVEAIGKEAFRDRKLTSVSIPSTVTSIGDWAFAHNNLTEVTIPPDVYFIGREAFYDNKLTEVTIPPGMTHIPYWAFAYNKLTKVTIPPTVTYIDAGAFFDNQLTSVTIPPSVTYIGAEAFYDNDLTQVIIPDGVGAIKKRAFAANKLTSVTLPYGVTIGKEAFGKNDILLLYRKDGYMAGTYIYRGGRWNAQ